MTKDFQFIDDSNVPPSIKPMVVLHDKLVRGYIADKDINLPKLICKMEDGLKEQVVEMTKIEDQTQFVSLRLVKVLNNIRKLIYSARKPNVPGWDKYDGSKSAIDVWKFDIKI